MKCHKLFSLRYCLYAGVLIPGDQERQYTVGKTETLSCISDSDATMIEWLSGGNTRVAITTTERTLNYTLDPVSDDIHETTFTCRVTRTTGVAEQSITLTLTGKLILYICVYNTRL